MTGDDDGFADLEPVDLEPVGADSDRDLARFDRDRGRPHWIWMAAGACGLAAWAAIALTTRHDHASRDTTPTTTPTSVAPVVRVDHVAVAGDALRDGLARLGVKRFASVIDDRLYAFDSKLREPTLVPLPEGHVTISDLNGTSLLAWTFQQTLVSTSPIGIRPLPVRDVPIRAITPGRWWLVNNGTIRPDRGGPTTRVPPGLHVVAEVVRGFVAYDDSGHWQLWSNATITPIMFPFPVDQFLVASPRGIVFLGGCGDVGCNLYIYDADQSRLVQLAVNGVPAFGTFSPDGRRLAIATNRGVVFVLDSANGQTLARTESVSPPSPSLPLSWTANGRALLVVQAGRIEIRRTTDGAYLGSIDPTDGVEQLVALP